MMERLMRKLQEEYRADVAGFGEVLSIQNPYTWNKVKDKWDDTFSRSKVTFKYDLNITDFGSYTE
ncbi:Spore germination protein B3 precursor [compost metagenome]